MITITEEEEEVIPTSTAEAATPPRPTTTTDKEAAITSNRTATMIITSRTIQTPITPLTLNTITLSIQSGTFLELRPPPTTVILMHLTTFSRHSSRRPSAT